MAKLRDIVFLVAVALSIPLVVLGIIYAVSLKHDINGLKQTNFKLYNEVATQRQLTQKQQELTTKQLDLSQSQLNVAQQQLETSRQLLGLSQSMDSKLSLSLSLQRQLLNTAQATLQQAREINRKMPPSLQTASPAAQILP
jgi:paraquat-inducible protein B